MKRITIALIVYSFINQAHADDSNNQCGDFHIQISNLTKEACVLTSHRVKHGNLTTPPPLSILPNDSKRFDMSQTAVYGPDITLSYQCGAEIISFTSQQNLCAFEAGDIHGEIVHPLPVDINAIYTAINGSYFWKKSGSINWSIVNNGG